MPFDCDYVAQECIEIFQKRILEWGLENFTHYPWRSTTNEWHALVAEIMLQRTKADQVEPVYVDFVRLYDSPKDFLDNPVNVFSRLGLPARNEQLIELNRIIAARGLPHTRVDLLQLPGIGEYTAAAFLSLHCGIRDTLIDSNIVRVYGRFFGFCTDTETRRKKWFKQLAERITPTKNYKEFNYALIDFSRNVCKVRPAHNACPVKERCHTFISDLDDAAQSV